MLDKAMWDVVSRFKSIIPVKSGIAVDDQWDQLNRRCMFLLLCTFSIIVTLRQYTGHVISCDGFTKFNDHFANDYCWTQGLYTVSEAYDKPIDNVPYPGIVPEDMLSMMKVQLCQELRQLNGYDIKCPPVDRNPKRIYHLWYQWIPFYFWLTATAFFLPYLFYKNLGMGELKPLINLLHNPVETESDMERTVNKAGTWLFYRFAGYMVKTKSCVALFHRHKLGSLVIIVKSLYFFVAFGCIYLTSRMFDTGDFLSYGKDWISSSINRHHNVTPIKDRLFPKMAACEIKRWGASGIEEEQGTCVLAPNVIHQYLFLILWFALVFMVIANGISLALTLIKLFFLYGSYRRLLFAAFIKDDPVLRHIYYHVGSSGRIILHLLATNIKPKVFEEVLKLLIMRMKKNKLFEYDIEHLCSEMYRELGQASTSSQQMTMSPGSSSPRARPTNVNGQARFNRDRL